MSMIVRVRAGIAGIAQLHLQRNVNGGIRLANNEKQRRQMEQQFDSIYYPLFVPIWQGRFVP